MACGGTEREFAPGKAGTAGEENSAGTSGAASRGGSSNPPRPDTNSGDSGNTGNVGEAGNSQGGAAGDGIGGAATTGTSGSAQGGTMQAGGTAGAVGTAVCGDSVTQASSEQCDDGNETTETCTYGEKSCTVCDATCHLVSGSISFCGDGAVRAGYETCDDDNAVTESCSYGAPSCSVCDSTCHSVPGAISYCGDSVRQMEKEACDNGASNSINGNCSPTCTACDKVAGMEPVTYDDISWTGGVSFTVTKATTLHQFKVYHNDSNYRLNLYQLSAADTSPAADATPIWSMPSTPPKSSTFDTVNVSLKLAAGKSYLLSTVGQVMSVSVPNPAVAYPVQSLSGIKVTKSFAVEDGRELNEGVFRTTSWGPFTDLRSCLESPN